MKKNGGFSENWGFGLCLGKTGNGGVWVVGGGWVDRRRAGGGVSAVGEAMGGGGLVWESGFGE
jgi:hypothetical protein